MTDGEETSPSVPPPAAGSKPAAGPPALKAHEHAWNRDWPRYYDAVAGKPARDTLLKALALFDEENGSDAATEPRLAVDLGCGSGRDTFELLRRGWRTIAVDHTDDGLQRLAAQARDLRLPLDQLTLVRDDLERFDPMPCMLLNASYSLPFCNPAAFGRLWTRIRAALLPGARFAGQIFGDRDDWATLADRTHHTRAQAEQLLDGLLIEQFEEKDAVEPGATGIVKRWHVFHIVAKQPR